MYFTYNELCDDLKSFHPFVRNGIPKARERYVKHPHAIGYCTSDELGIQLGERAIVVMDEEKERARYEASLVNTK